jgi:hypothetical protein
MYSFSKVKAVGMGSENLIADNETLVDREKTKELKSKFLLIIVYFQDRILDRAIHTLGALWTSSILTTF